MNYLEEYYKQIRKGKILAPAKVIATYSHLIENMRNKKSEYTYDNKKALHAIEFIEKFCKHSKGKKAGKPFLLELWQKAFISAVFGFVDKKTGFRQYKEAILIIGRKNGKSTLASAIANYLLFADGEAGPEIVSAATKKDQAKIIWEESCKMIRKSPALRKNSKVLFNEIKTYFNEGTYKPVSSESNTLDGLNLHGAFIDELHAIINMNLYDVLKDSVVSRNQPLVLITTTNGPIRNSVFDIKYSEIEKLINGYTDKKYIDENLLAIVYELDEKEEIWNPDNWIKANPSIDTIKDRKQLETKVYKAKNDNRLLNNLLCKDFNVAVTANTRFFTLKDIENPITFNIPELEKSYYIAGFDLSNTTDLTAAAILFKTDSGFYTDIMYWIPEEKVNQLEEETGAPLSIWIEKGYIRTCRGNLINSLDILNWFLELQEKYNVFPYKIAYDPWGAAALVDQLKIYYGKNSTIPVRQGKQSLSLPMKEIKAYFQSKQIIYNNNPVTAWNLLNVQSVSDINGNIQPSKNRNDTKQRIDGFAALLNAFKVYLDEAEQFSYIN